MNKIIFDTDIGGDCDDAGALAILHEAQNAGKAELLAVTLPEPLYFTFIPYFPKIALSGM